MIKRLCQQVAMQDKCLPYGGMMLMYCWILMGIFFFIKREPDTAAETMTSVAGAGGESWKVDGKPMGFVAKVLRFMSSYKRLSLLTGRREGE